MMVGVRSWRRLRRRTAAAAEELGTTFDVLRQEPHPVRTAYRTGRAVLQLKMKPQDVFLFNLDRRPAAEVREFLSKRSHTQLQDLLNPSQHHHLVQNKLDYHVACVARGVAAPPVMALLDFGKHDGCSAKLNATRIESEADMAAFLGSLPNPTRLIFKSFWGSLGRGLLSLTVDSGNAIDTDGQRLGPQAISRHCQTHRADGGFLVQAWLEPDPALRPLMPGRTLGTVRVVTVLDGDQVRLPPYAYLKIPAGTLAFDAFDHGKSGNLVAAVNVTDGRLGVPWRPSLTRMHRVETCAVHPDTGVAIEGFRIPHWYEVLRTVTMGARAFPEFLTLGWDVAITSRGIFLLEGNHRWDPQVPQLLLRRGIRHDMEKLVEQAGFRIPAS